MVGTFEGHTLQLTNSLFSRGNRRSGGVQDEPMLVNLDARLLIYRECESEVVIETGAKIVQAAETCPELWAQGAPCDGAWRGEAMQSIGKPRVDIERLRVIGHGPNCGLFQWDRVLL